MQVPRSVKGMSLGEAYLAAGPREPCALLACFRQAVYPTCWHALPCTQVFVFNAENYSGDAQLVNR